MAAFDFRDAVFKMQEYGIVDVILPFILIFSIFFAILQKTKILGHDKNNNPHKNFNVVVALAMGFAFIYPHVTGRYPPTGDPVAIIAKATPQIVLVMIAGIAFFILAGLVIGKDVVKNYASATYSFITLILVNVFFVNAYPSLADFVLILSAYAIVLSLVLGGTGATGSVSIIIVLIVFFVFHWAMTGWNQAVPSWLSWLEDSNVQTLVIVALTFITVVSLILGKSESAPAAPKKT